MIVCRLQRRRRYILDDWAKILQSRKAPVSYTEWTNMSLWEQPKTGDMIGRVGDLENCIVSRFGSVAQYI